ncbi:MAG TPA: hypothetical protein VMV57_06430, partial [Terracidiphilus sp.]|nr:hypothetical protein [Terracidiphilus sp.]
MHPSIQIQNFLRQLFLMSLGMFLPFFDESSMFLPFFAAYNSSVDPAGLLDGLGERYEIARTNIKKWTVGSPIQAPLDALELPIKKHSFGADQVRKVTMRIAT